MFKKTLVAAALAALCGSTFAASYYVVVPLAKKAASSPGSTTPTPPPPPPPPVVEIVVSLSEYGLPQATVGDAYPSVDFRNSLTVTGDSAFNVANVVWTLNGTLPTGLSFVNGVLSGTPSQDGSYSFTVNADYKGKSAQQTYSIQVVKAFGTPAQLTYGISSPGYTWTSTNSAAGKYGVFSNVGITKGSWYAEIQIDDNYSSGQYALYEIGISSDPATSSGRAWFAEVAATTAMGVYIHPYSSYFCSYTHCAPGMANIGNVLNPSFYWLKGDVLGMAINADANSIEWYRNGVKIYQTLSITTAKPWYVGASSAYKPTASGLKFNFGQQTFKYAVPAGYMPGIGSAAQ